MKQLLKQYKGTIRVSGLVLLSYLTGISLATVSGYGITGIEWMIPFLMIFAGTVYYKAKGCVSRRELIYAAPLGFLFALTIVVGSKIEIYEEAFHEVSFMDVVAYPFISTFFTALILLLFSLSDKMETMVERCKQEKRSAKELDRKKKGLTRWMGGHPFFCLFLFYTVCYLPYYLTFFPGNCGKDTWESVNMALGNIPWTNHHPVLFTGLIMVVIKMTSFLSLTGSIGVFSLLQMLSMAAVLAMVSVRIMQMRVPVMCKLFTVAMFGIHPFLGMYSVYLTKDVIFAQIMVMLSLKIYDVITQNGELFNKPWECVKLAVMFLLTCMLRNNGLYIAVIMAVLFLFLYKKYWKRIWIVFVCAIGLFQIWQGPVFKTMGIEKQSFAEAASVPLQQIGYVLWEGNTFSEEDMAFLEKLMPVEKVREVYQPGYTDPYKFDENFNDDFLNENVGEFLGVWWNGCKQHFDSYVEAYLMQTVGYWHYGETNSIGTQGCTENDLGVVQVDVIQNITGISLEPIVEKLVLAGRKAPIICMFGSMAMQMVMVFLLILQYMRRKNTKQAIWLLPVVLLWGTIMVATPAFCLLRYLFPIFLLWPFMIAEFLKV